MTNNNRPITPPPELVHEWAKYATGYYIPGTVVKQIATQAARWGGDQELEACKQVILDQRWFATPGFRLDQLHNARRPKPPSLKEAALAELDLLKGDANAHGLGFDAPAIRRALEQLND